MRFLTYDELTSSMETDRNLIHLASFGSAFSRRSVDLWRHRTKSFADYVALFAADRGRLLGQTFVLRIPYSFPGGTEIVSGIAAVGTRPDRGRAGVARAILKEVHRLEREAGIRFSTLWTNRSWGAHNLYEEIGYRDVYASPWVVRAPVTVALRRPPGVRPARKADLCDVEQLHAQLAAGRLGFRRNPNGYLTVATAARELDPSKELIVHRNGGRLRGYAHIDSNPYRTICGEVVATSRAVRRALVTEVQRRAKGATLAFQYTPVTDSPDLFRGRSCSSVGTGWFRLMAHSFDRSFTEREAQAEFGTNDSRFLCMAGDRF